MPVTSIFPSIRSLYIAMGNTFSLNTTYWITPVKLANGVQAHEIWAGIPLYIRQCLFVIHSESFPSAKLLREARSEPIESSDGHELCIFCLGRVHAEVALGGLDCPHCGDMSLWTLRLHVAIVQGEEVAQLTLPHSSSAASFEPRRKVPRVSDADLSGWWWARAGSVPTLSSPPCCRSPSSVLHDRWSPPLPRRSRCGDFWCHGGHWRGGWCHFGGSVCEKGMVQQHAGLHCAPVSGWGRAGPWSVQIAPTCHGYGPQSDKGDSESDRPQYGESCDARSWLTLTELKDSEKTALLDAPVN